MKKLLIAAFVLSFTVAPVAASAGFFDFFKTNQTAQVRTAVSSDNLILKVQQALTTQGFYKGDLSGVVGAKTKTAIKSFQKMNKLPMTGLLDKVTVDGILKGGGVVGCMDPASINYNPLATIPGPCNFGGGSANVSYPSRICNENTGSWVKVTSPNGGEVYTAGETINVTWQSCNIASGVIARIEFISPFSGVSVQNVFTPNTGSVSYVLPASSLFAPSNYGNHYKVGITYPSLSVPEDQSNSNFSIIEEIGNGNDNPPLRFVNYGSSGGDINLDNDGVGVITFLANVINTSNETIYFENSCGTGSSGLTVRLEKVVGTQFTTVTPLHADCFTGFMGSGMSPNTNFLEPGVSREIFITYSFDPSVNFAEYRIIVDGINYRTPLMNSSLTHLDLHPQTHPQANPWDDLVSGAIPVNN